VKKKGGREGGMHAQVLKSESSWGELQSLKLGKKKKDSGATSFLIVLIVLRADMGRIPAARRRGAAAKAVPEVHLLVRILCICALLYNAGSSWFLLTFWYYERETERQRGREAGTKKS
jgi:hypothetical protein